MRSDKFDRALKGSKYLVIILVAVKSKESWSASTGGARCGQVPPVKVRGGVYLIQLEMAESHFPPLRPARKYSG